MKILVNKEKLDFTLENEKNLLEVIESIENWLNDQNVVISLINVDGIDISPDMKHTLETFDLGKINNVEIETATQTEMAIVGLQDTFSYIDKFIAEIDKDREYFLQNKNEKIEGLNWITEVVFSATRVLNINVSLLFHNENNLEEVIAFLAISADQLELKKHDDNFFYDYFVTGVKERLEMLKNMIPVIIQNAIFQSSTSSDEITDDNVIKIIKSLKDNVYSMQPNLEKISGNFQSGKDVEALIGIKKIAGVLDYLVISLKRIEDILGLDYNKLEINGKTVKQINEGLLEVVTEIFNAFKDKDTVLLSDLIEYELSDYFEIYKDVLETILIITNQKKMVN